MKISYSFGMVDLLHYGHIRGLMLASKDADMTIFGLVSDSASDAWFGVHVSNETERKAVIESIKYVDYIMPQKTFDPIDNLREIHNMYPEARITLFHGDEWGITPAKKYLETIGGSVITFEYYDKLSPQKILDTLNHSENKNKILGNLISTKANTLVSLKGMLSKSKIEDIYITTIKDYHKSKENVVKEIKTYFKWGNIVVRSSSKKEDLFQESNAGHFKSVLNIDVTDERKIKKAIDEVISSYGEDHEENEQVLIQRQTENVIFSGVIFTRDIQRNRPYYVINYDDSGSTNSVTSGFSGKTAWMLHTIKDEHVPAKWAPLIEAVREVENLLSGMLLDIEFAITSTDIVLFQIRPLAAVYKFGRNEKSGEAVNARNVAIKKYKELKKTGLACYSDMAFWNPAEIIGDKPKNLDYSLYREIITKEAWNQGIIDLGYRPLPKELMFRYANKPYISIEYSLEALIPSDISEPLTKKLKEYYLKEFKSDFSTHDKIEFEISLNCFNFSLYKRLEKLKRDGFSKKEISELELSLRNITVRMINDYVNILDRDINDLRQLECIRLDTQNLVKNSDDHCLISKSIHLILQAISKYGTPQFSRHARCAFVAKSLLNSLLDEGYISSSTYHNFLSTINTVATNYDNDYLRVLKGDLSKEEFRSRYGHLRAGTYNIRSPRYDQIEDFFGKKEHISSSDWHLEGREEDIRVEIQEAISLALKDRNMDELNAKNVYFFLRKSTQMREYFKFIFTKSLSYAIELIKEIGKIVNINIFDLSYLELPEIFAAEYYFDLYGLKEFWELVIEKRRELYRINNELILPSIICSERDFEYVEDLETRPNYITEKKVIADVVSLNDGLDNMDIEGKIVIIEKADPGFDWIFSKGIVGLVTKYGGAASHMAIRCAEFEIPAVIGCGAKLYEYVLGTKRVMIDCKNEKVK